ncbi:MAG: chemotaxis protein CheW, partial [Candidatus Cloacimonetes bacterium]|nr:chemotaxis protein CheW [Candidatus Cloacimonadota bacterium]
ELVGIQDVVIKKLGEKFSDLKGVSGATILGNGNVGLILDANSLVTLE